MDTPSIQSISSQLMQSPKGLLAADESNKSITKRFEALGIACNVESRRSYRQMLLTTPKFAQYISGVIFYDETIKQNTDTGQSFVDLLTSQGIIPGIKVDSGLVELNNFAPETITSGLDGLAERLKDYYTIGARFTKWRAAFSIDQAANKPSATALHANMHALAQYASLVQSTGMVPIVEPEVLYDGDHSLEQSQEVTTHVLRVLFDTLKAYKVDLTGLILKTSMVLAGKNSTKQSSTQEIATATLRVLNDRVPHETAGIVFLSGGQTPSQASSNLNAITQSGKQPWPISFSFSRAVQEPALNTWRGEATNIELAQAKFSAALATNSLARDGKLNTKNTQQ